MSSLVSITRSGSRALSYLLGIAVLGLAIGVGLTEFNITDILNLSDKIFSGLFLALFSGLVYVSVLSIVRVSGRPITETGVRTWFEAGVQAANAIATLALTYTLFGISLGIGSLAGQDLNPSTVSGIIRSLTENFSMAFMTTVIGLPVSAILRAILLVDHSRSEERANVPFTPLSGE